MRIRYNRSGNNNPQEDLECLKYLAEMEKEHQTFKCLNYLEGGLESRASGNSGHSLLAAAASLRSDKFCTASPSSVYGGEAHKT